MAQDTSLYCFLTVRHVCLLRLVSSPRHPCPPSAYATLTGIDFSRDQHFHLPYQPRRNVCVRARGRENRHEARSQNQPGTPVIRCDDCFLKTEEDAPMVTVLVAVDAVYRQMVAIPLEKTGNRDPHASRSLAAFARYVVHPEVIIQGDSEHALHAQC